MSILQSRLGNIMSSCQEEQKREIHVLSRLKSFRKVKIYLNSLNSYFNEEDFRE